MPKVDEHFEQAEATNDELAVKIEQMKAKYKKQKIAFKAAQTKSLEGK